MPITQRAQENINNARKPKDNANFKTRQYDRDQGNPHINGKMTGIEEQIQGPVHGFGLSAALVIRVVVKAKTPSLKASTRLLS
jgi:hypothetical protein